MGTISSLPGINIYYRMVTASIVYAIVFLSMAYFIEKHLIFSFVRELLGKNR